METLKEEDLESILLGCTVLGTGGGGDLKKGLERVKRDIESEKKFKIMSLNDIPDDALVASPYHCGSLTSSGEEAKIPEDILSFKALQEYFRENFFATVSTELGGGNTATALSVAANMDIPIVDGDPAGRSVPELQHSTFFINNVSIAPMSVANKFGDVVIVKKVLDDFRAEKIVRSIAVASGGSVGVTDHPMRGENLKTSIISNTISHAKKIGGVLKKTRDYRRVAEAGGGYILFKGEVVDSPWKDEGGFTVGEIYIEGTEEYNRSKYKVWYKNENLMAWRDNKIDITAPDLICILSKEDAMPVTNPNCRKGIEVVVVGYPAPKEWRTKRGIEILGPKSFGFDCDYIPIEEKIK